MCARKREAPPLCMVPWGARGVLRVLSACLGREGDLFPSDMCACKRTQADFPVGMVPRGTRGEIAVVIGCIRAAVLYACGEEGRNRSDDRFARWNDLE